MNKQRKPGFYWVYHRDEWMVAQWYDPESSTSTGCWLLPGYEQNFDDSYLDEIREIQLLEPGKIPERTSIVSAINQLGGRYGRH